ncbi:MAG: YigZ family protein [Xanthomonadales bacterium]|nr:YigZ family protein [Xanthomonadales bacterium]
MTQLHTLAAPASLEQEIRKSRFLALAESVEDAAAALAFIARVGTADATHNCWAYRIGQDYRFNDDGEPGGSAGRPILAAIEGQGFDRVAVLVTRWYGGIKLGVGGLVRAYGGTAAECLRTAPRRPLVDLAEIRFDCGFALLASLHARLPEFSASKLEERFHAEGAELTLRLPRERLDDFRGWLRDLSRGRSEVRELDPADG